MKSKLLEGNIEIDKLLKSLYSIIVTLRKNTILDQDIVKDIQDFYDIEIGDYLKDYYLLGKEVEPEYEEYISDMILKFIVYLRGL